MDTINNAIATGYHISSKSNWKDKTWEDFEQAIDGKKVILCGIGAGANYFCYRYANKMKIEAIIDNDVRLQGVKAQELISEDLRDENLEISSKDILKKYREDEIVIIIASLKYYDEIDEQLQSLGNYMTFSVLQMEAIRRGENPVDEEEKRYEVYVKEACNYPICNHKIVFYTMCDFAGHGKEIAKQLLRLYPELDIVWIVNNLQIEVPKGIRLVYKKNIRSYINEMETAKLWIYDVEAFNYLEKRPGQYNIQIKHWASVTLKKFGFDMDKFLEDKNFISMRKSNSEKMDYLLVGSDFDERTCRSGFQFDGKVVHVGSPRSDVLFCPEESVKVVREKYNIDEKIHCLLYAPTFRCKKGKEYRPGVIKVDMDFAKVKDSLEKRYGGSWKILLRQHPGIARQKFDLPEYVINVSDYYDSQELVAASDILVTDYSSIMFEPAFVRKPVFLLATDREEYVEEERGFWIDYDTLPFPIAETNEELVENIANFNQAEYERKVTEFLENYGVHEDGHASERAAQFILELLGEENGTDTRMHK